MTGSHPEIGPELRQLAQTILDKLDPAVRLAAARRPRCGQSDRGVELVENRLGQLPQLGTDVCV